MSIYIKFRETHYTEYYKKHKFSGIWNFEQLYNAFEDYLPDYVLENTRRLYNSENKELAIHTLYAVIVDNEGIPQWKKIMILLERCFHFEGYEHCPISQAFALAKAKKSYRRELRFVYDIHFDNNRQNIRRYLNTLQKRFGEITDDHYFTNYNNKFYNTKNIDEFRFWLRTHGKYHYEFNFDFLAYEYEFSESENGFIFTRRIDRGKNEVICFIAYIGGYWRKPAKLLKGIYNRETKKFLPKNINYIKKRLKK